MRLRVRSLLTNLMHLFLINTGINFNLVCLELKKLLGLVSSKIDVPYSLEMGI